MLLVAFLVPVLPFAGLLRICASETGLLCSIEGEGREDKALFRLLAGSCCCVFTADASLKNCTYSRLLLLKLVMESSIQPSSTGIEYLL